MFYLILAFTFLSFYFIFFLPRNNNNNKKIILWPPAYPTTPNPDLAAMPQSRRSHAQITRTPWKKGFFLFFFFFFFPFPPFHAHLVSKGGIIIFVRPRPFGKANRLEQSLPCAGPALAMEPPGTEGELQLTPRLT